jgi:hypothetical protein
MIEIFTAVAATLLLIVSVRSARPVPVRVRANRNRR